MCALKLRCGPFGASGITEGTELVAVTAEKNADPREAGRR
jgi:hypothetical protein